MTADNKGTVLIIEDAAGFRSIYRTFIEADNYEVLEADDGRKGLEVAIEQKPDLILLDLLLPEFDGLQVLKELRANRKTKSIPVIILSVLGERETMEKTLELGANDYSIKGEVSPREVLVKIRALLAGRDVSEDIESYRVSVKEGRDDAARLEGDVGVPGLHECPHCTGRVVLELVPDTTHTEGHWYSARFICVVCGSTL
jgi:DNA-binding response OmpR family regulator